MSLSRSISCSIMLSSFSFFFFFFNDTATTEIYTLSLHDALPISSGRKAEGSWRSANTRMATMAANSRDRKSTRLNSSHLVISYAVFCLKKKKKRNSHGRAIVALRGDVYRASAYDRRIHVATTLRY